MPASLSIIIPCYKEEEVITANIIAIHEFVHPRFAEYEIIVITDGSPDGTKERIEELQQKRSDIPLVPIYFDTNRGKGAAIRAGMEKARYELALMIDADLTISIEELDGFLKVIGETDMAIASRLAPGTVFEESSPFHRVLTARIFHILQIVILGNFEFSDTQCGFKLFRRERVIPLFKILTIERFAFDAELLFLARKMNLRVATLPIRIRKDTRNTNVRIVRDSFNMFGALLKIRINDFTGRYAQLIK